MPRWATTYQDIKHISDLTHDMPFGGVVLAKLRNMDVTVPAVMLGSNMGNNGGRPYGYTGDGRPGPWHYHAEVTLQMLNGQTQVFDLLDIERIDRASEEWVEKFKDAGLIRIVKWLDDE